LAIVTPTPPPVCVTGPCTPTISPTPVCIRDCGPLPNPTPTPKPICLPGDQIDTCAAEPLTGRCMTIQQPCITPSAELTMGPSVSPLIISEFRFRGPAGAADEFVELFNPRSWPITITTDDGSDAWALVASDGLVRFTIPAGTVIPGYGHYLAVNSVGYSLGRYPSGNGSRATGDNVYLLDIPDRAGIALFSSSNPVNFTPAYRMDAAGYSEAPALYREGAGFPSGGAETLFNIEYSFYRNLTAGLPKDTNDNTADFMGVDTNATNTGAGQHLGAPGPENLSSPVFAGTDKVTTSLIDPAVPRENPPNRVQDPTPDPENNSSLGTLSIRRRFTNVTGANITRLRFRIVDVTTYPSPTGIADLRAINSGTTQIDPTAEIVEYNQLIFGTTLETPPAQINGGGWNSTLSADRVSPSTPLGPGQGINVQFLLGIQQSGNFRFFIVVEALP
jgi:hypothetical protein